MIRDSVALVQVKVVKKYWITNRAHFLVFLSVLSASLILIGYPMGRFGPVRRVALEDVVYEDRWGQPFADRV